MSKQSAVRFLVREIKDIVGIVDTTYKQKILILNAIQKAQKMEREQIIDAWNSCGESIMTEEFDNAEQYYEQTYGVKGRENKTVVEKDKVIKVEPKLGEWGC
jgi:predicted phosphodiesterase